MSNLIVIRSAVPARFVMVGEKVVLGSLVTVRGAYRVADGSAVASAAPVGPAMMFDVTDSEGREFTIWTTQDVMVELEPDLEMVP